MSRSRRQKYPDDFKKDAVNYLLSNEKSVTGIADELGVERYNLSRWKQELLGKSEEEVPEMNEDPKAKMRRLEESNKRMEKIYPVSGRKMIS